MNINPTWTDARIERLTELWRDGMSAGQIAKILGGVSRNAVIGKIHRLGLQHHSGHVAVAKVKKSEEDKKRIAKRQQIERDRAAREERRRAAARERAASMAAQVETPSPALPGIDRPAPLNFRLMDLSHIDRAAGSDCRYIVAETGEHAQFCGHNTNSGEPYCSYHMRVCYIPREVRLSKKRAA